MERQHIRACRDGSPDRDSLGCSQFVARGAEAVSHLEGAEQLHYLVDLIETVNTPELVRQHRDEFKNR
jgi:hypothetical protein